MTIKNDTFLAIVFSMGMIGICFYGVLDYIYLFRPFQILLMLSGFIIVFSNGLKILDVFILLLCLSYFIVASWFHDVPPFGIFYLLSGYFFSRVVSNEVSNKVMSTVPIFVLFGVLNYLIGFIFFNHDRVFFIDGDPNYTALYFAMVHSINSLKKQSLSPSVINYVCLISILMSFSRTGFLYVLFVLLIQIFPYLRSLILRQNFFSVFLVSQILGVLVAYYVLFVVMGNIEPEYIEFAGATRLSSDSLIDVSNFIRLKAMLFFLDETKIQTILLGSTQYDLVAFEFNDKFITPHHFLIGQLWHFGIIGLLITLRAVYFKRVLCVEGIALLVIFGSLLGFGPFYGYILIYLGIISNCSRINKNFEVRKINHA